METVGRYGASYSVVVLMMNFRGSCGNLFNCRGCCAEESTPTILQAASTRMNPQMPLPSDKQSKRSCTMQLLPIAILLYLVLSTCERRRCAIRIIGKSIQIHEFKFIRYPEVHITRQQSNIRVNVQSPIRALNNSICHLHSNLVMGCGHIERLNGSSMLKKA